VVSRLDCGHFECSETVYVNPRQSDFRRIHIPAVKDSLRSRRAVGAHAEKLKAAGENVCDRRWGVNRGSEQSDDALD